MLKFNKSVLPLAFPVCAALSCNDTSAEGGVTSDASTNEPTLGTSADSGEGSCSPTGSDGGEHEERVLRVPENFELCVMSLPRTTQASRNAPLFSMRAVLRIAAGDFAVPAEPGVEQALSIPYSLQLDEQGTTIEEYSGSGTVVVARDMVPSSIYMLDDATGWDTVVHTGDGFRVRLATPSCERDFVLGGIVELEEQMLRIVETRIPPPTSGGEPIETTFAGPCVDLDATFDRVDFTFAEGRVSFHTRPGRWRGLDGFTVLAEGELDGDAFAVDSYWDLEYGTNTPEFFYGFFPMLAVRFGERMDGSCILLLEWTDVTENYEARVLDCYQNELRTLSIESMEVIAGGGTPAW